MKTVLFISILLIISSVYIVASFGFNQHVIWGILGGAYFNVLIIGLSIQNKIDENK